MRRIIGVAIGLALGFMMPTASAEPPSQCKGVDVNDARATDLADFLTGTSGRDVIALGTGADQYFAAEGDDLVCGGGGADVVVGEAGNDELDGEPGSDIVSGMGDADSVRGGYGEDTLKGGVGPDVLLSGIADDARDDLYDGLGADEVIGNVEDVWHRCEDGATDEHDAFFGNIVPDPDC